MTTITFDPDKLDETDALYLIDKISCALVNPDPITEALGKVAWDIAGQRDEDDAQEAAADELYPAGSLDQTVWHRFNATRDAYLRRFGFMREDV